jgi:hypothetical protein
MDRARFDWPSRIASLRSLFFTGAAVGPAHSLSGTIEPDCPPARPLTSSAAVRAPLPHASAALSKLHVQPLRFPATPTDCSRTIARQDINTSSRQTPLFPRRLPSPPATPSPSLTTESPPPDHRHSRTAGISIHGIQVPRLLNACSCRGVVRAPMLKRRRSRARTLPPT